VNFRWTFTFGVEKSYDGTHLAFGGTLDRRCHFKRISLKQSRFYHCQTSTAHRYRIKVDGSVATISIKNVSIGLHVMCLCLLDTSRKNGKVTPTPTVQWGGVARQMEQPSSASALSGFRVCTHTTDSVCVLQLGTWSKTRIHDAVLFSARLCVPP
jgi:hypothetical protein